MKSIFNDIDIGGGSKGMFLVAIVIVMLISAALVLAFVSGNTQLFSFIVPLIVVLGVIGTISVMMKSLLGGHSETRTKKKKKFLR